MTRTLGGVDENIPCHKSITQIFCGVLGVIHQSCQLEGFQFSFFLSVHLSVCLYVTFVILPNIGMEEIEVCCVGGANCPYIYLIFNFIIIISFRALIILAAPLCAIK